MKHIHWSGGTGRLAPSLFSYSDLDFMLILRALENNDSNVSYLFKELNGYQPVIQKVVK